MGRRRAWPCGFAQAGGTLQAIGSGGGRLANVVAFAESHPLNRGEALRATGSRYLLPRYSPPMSYSAWLTACIKLAKMLSRRRALSCG